MKYTKTQTAESLEYLHEALKPGDMIHTIVTHVSRSGMSRSIRTLIIKDSSHRDISYLVARALDERMDEHNGGIKVSGCGMDMGFETVYRLGYALYPEGFTCIGEKCPANDHSNGDRNYNPHLHKDGGYALRQQWL